VDFTNIDLMDILKEEQPNPAIMRFSKLFLNSKEQQKGQQSIQPEGHKKRIKRT